MNNLAIRLSEAGQRGEALEAAREAADLYKALAGASPAAYTPDLAMSLNNLATFLSEAGQRGEALQVFIEDFDRFSPATRARLLLARASWRNDNQDEDLTAAAHEADAADAPVLLGPVRRMTAHAIEGSGQDLEELPPWATVKIDAEMRGGLETWLNCNDESEQADLLEKTWNSLSDSERAALSAVAELYVDVPPIGDLAGLVNRIAEEGVEEVVLCLRRRCHARVLAADWYSAHTNGRGGRYLREHMMNESNGEDEDRPEWRKGLDDPRMRAEVLQLLETNLPGEAANELRAILRLADLSDPETAYEVHDSAENAENALEDLLKAGDWHAMVAALDVRPDLGDLRYGSIAAVLGAAMDGDPDRMHKLLERVYRMIDAVDRRLVESLLERAILSGDCPEGFKDLREWFRRTEGRGD